MGLDWISKAWYRYRAFGSCEHGNSPSEFTICRKLLITYVVVRILRRILFHRTCFISKYGLTSGVTNDNTKCTMFGLVNATDMAPERQNRRSRGGLSG